jgi:hypothetical protein
VQCTILVTATNPPNHRVAIMKNLVLNQVGAAYAGAIAAVALLLSVL